MSIRRAVALVAGTLALLGACSDDPKLAAPDEQSAAARRSAVTTEPGEVVPVDPRTAEPGGAQRRGTTQDGRGASGDGAGVPSGGGGRAGGRAEALGDYRAEGDYDNGRHIGHLSSFEDSTVGIDVVRFLRGDEAKEAYAQDTGSADAPPNDYYVQNQSKTVRMLPLGDGLVIRVNSAGGYEPSAPDEGRRVSSETFSSYFADGAVEGLFWITIEGGRVVAIEEQYLP